MNGSAGRQDRSSVLVRAMLQGGAGFCVLTVGGLAVLQQPGAVNIWLVVAILVVGGLLLASASRDLQIVLND